MFKVCIIGCGMCESGCYSGAKVVCGKEMTAREIFDRILLDKPYYSADGGVTFSGGEALSYLDILKELISLCKKEGVNTAIETSLYLYNEEILASLDFIMADFKIWNNEMHINYTGVSNERIKENFVKLDRLGVPFIVRTPLIPGITDSEENIKKYELLDYNPLGNSKAKALGKEILVLDSKAKTVK